MDDKKQNRWISKLWFILSLLLHWLIAVFFVIGGISELFKGHIFGGLFILLGAILIIPEVKQKINAETKRNFRILHFNSLAAILIIVGLVVTAVSEKKEEVSSATNSTPVQQSVANVPVVAPQQTNPTQSAITQPAKNSKISDDVYKPYDVKGYPKLTKKYKSRLDEIQQYRVKAAEMVLASKKCDNVFLSDLSDESSLKKLKFFVDCSSGKQDRRIYLTEDEIDKNASVVAQDEKGMDENEATLMCMKEIKAKSAQYPKVTTHEIAGTSSQKYQSGKVEVHMNFEVTNLYGVEIPYIGHCFFDENGKGTIKISRRSGAS